MDLWSLFNWLLWSYGLLCNHVFSSNVGKVVSDLLPRSEEVEPRRTGCLTITKEDGKWNIQPGSCNKTLPFLCTKGIVMSILQIFNSVIFSYVV